MRNILQFNNQTKRIWLVGTFFNDCGLILIETVYLITGPNIATMSVFLSILLWF